LFLLVLLSSDFVLSFQTYIKVFIAFIMYPFGYYYIEDDKALKKLNLSVTISLCVIVINSVIAQIYKLGDSPYLEDTFYLGGGLVQVSYIIVIALVVSPLTLSQITKRANKYLLGLIYFASFVVLLFMFRRTSYIAIFVGYGVYFLNSVNKKRIFKYVLTVILLISLFFLSFPEVSNKFSDLVDKRLHQRQLNEEGRVRFTMMVFEEFMDNSAWQKLFGKEIFNSEKYFNAGRGLHTDYNIIFHGSGLVGMMLYAALFFLMAKSMLTHKRYAQSNRFYKELYSVYGVLLITSLIISFSGSLAVLSYRALLFFYLGGILRLFEKQRESALKSDEFA
jgi:hypothetical protein